MKDNKYKVDDILKRFDEKDEVQFDPYFSSKISHLIQIQAKESSLQGRFRASLVGAAMLLILLANGVSFIKQYESAAQNTNERVLSVKQLSSTYFSNNE